jgi:hypothetical protein
MHECAGAAVHHSAIESRLLWHSEMPVPVLERTRHRTPTQPFSGRGRSRRQHGRYEERSRPKRRPAPPASDRQTAVSLEGLADRLIQVGLRTINRHHRDQFKRFGVEVIEAGRCGQDIRLELTSPVYLSVDIDALDPAFAPGVSHREPGGLSTRQVIDLIHTINQPIVAADIVEYNPRCDISDLTVGVAVKLLKEIAGMMVKTNG